MQRLFLIAGALFIGFLVVSVVTRSGERKSLLDASLPTEDAADVLASERSPVKSGSELHLQDFHRVEMREGRRIWEVKARDAKYYSEEQLAHVSDAEVLVFREKNSTVRFRSKAGKLYLSGDALRKADMEGDIQVTIDDSLRVSTEFATYDTGTEMITAPGEVTVSGTGFFIRGVGMEVSVKTHEVRLFKDVESRFEKGAEVKKSVSQTLG